MNSHVRQEIEQAFAGLRMPSRQALVDLQAWDELDLPEAREIQNALAGREWTSLEADLLKKYWSSFGYLTPEAYRYYLPALLVRSLKDPAGEDTLMDSAFAALLPDFETLYVEGEDPDYNDQISLFSEAQYKAVCSFLELGFEPDKQSQFEVCAALMWQWGKYEHPAQARARDFFREMHNFRYPESQNPLVRELILQIRSAFDATPCPSNEEICEYSDNSELAEYIFMLGSTDWKTLHPDFLANYQTALSFITPQAFRYFLPAYMIADLMQPEMPEALKLGDLLFDLAYGFADEEHKRAYRALDEDEAELYGEELLRAQEALDSRIPFDSFEHAAKKCSLFNARERGAIIQFLRYKATDEDRKAIIELALKHYWLKS